MVSAQARLTSLHCLEGCDQHQDYVQPHVDLHKNEVLCWFNSAPIVSAQLAGFLHFDLWREGKLSKEGQESEVEKWWGR